MPIARAKLGPYDADPNLPDLVFALNPSSVRRSTMPVYADSNVALADFGRFNPLGGIRPFEWVRNRPEEIRIEALILPNAAIDGRMSDADDVEAELILLDRFAQKSTRTGEPPDLIFSMGVRHDYVRITTKEVDEKLYAPDLRVQHAIVHLTLRTIT